MLHIAMFIIVSILDINHFVPLSTFALITPVILVLSSPKLVTLPKVLFYISCKNLKSIGYIYGGVLGI